MSELRPKGCGAASVSTRLFAFGGEDDGVREPGWTTMYDMMVGKVEEVARPPRALRYCAGDPRP